MNAWDVSQHVPNWDDRPLLRDPSRSLFSSAPSSHSRLLHCPVATFTYSKTLSRRHSTGHNLVPPSSLGATPSDSLPASLHSPSHLNPHSLHHNPLKQTRTHLHCTSLMSTSASLWRSNGRGTQPLTKLAVVLTAAVPQLLRVSAAPFVATAAKEHHPSPGSDGTCSRVGLKRGIGEGVRNTNVTERWAGCCCLPRQRRKRTSLTLPCNISQSSTPSWDSLLCWSSWEESLRDLL